MLSTQAARMSCYLYGQIDVRRAASPSLHRRRVAAADPRRALGARLPAPVGARARPDVRRLAWNRSPRAEPAARRGGDRGAAGFALGRARRPARAELLGAAQLFGLGQVGGSRA